MKVTRDEKQKKYSLGIDIGGTKCAVVLGKGNIPDTYEPGFILERKSIVTSLYSEWKETVDSLIEILKDMIQKYDINKNELVGIGISCGGPLDYQKGIILNPPNLIGWDEVAIVDILKRHFDIPIFLQNDANACAMAEWKFGAARGMNNVIFLTFGTGLGAGLILDGKLYHGKNDMAGEVGHIRLTDYGPVGYGKAGSMEGFCSGGGIAQIAKMKILERMQLGEKVKLLNYIDHIDHISTEKIAQAAKEGDELAQEIFYTSAKYLGRGLAIMIDILNPEIIVIGSIYERCEELFYDTMNKELHMEALKRSAFGCKVVPSELKDEIGDYAALSVAFRQEGG